MPRLMYFSTLYIGMTILCSMLRVSLPMQKYEEKLIVPNLFIIFAQFTLFYEFRRAAGGTPTYPLAKKFICVTLQKIFTYISYDACYLLVEVAF